MHSFEAAVELPLSLHDSVALGELHLPDGTMLTAHLGLTEDMARALKERSLDEADEEIQNNTSDRRRFGEGSYEEWFARERYPFVLTDSAGKLTSLIWFGPEPLPSDGEELSTVQPQQDASEWDTMGFRSYMPYRGKGIMTPFSRFVIETYLRIRPQRCLWLATGVENGAGIRLYEKLGFVRAGLREGGARLIMVMA